ncbi:hypothetical protein C8Q79DRAFT_280481 [Trametes meyenii]|nr:hypothetical protein C8Q79DRAFT_280481 [Trametes meyenii]
MFTLPLKRALDWGTAMLPLLCSSLSLDVSAYLANGHDFVLHVTLLRPPSDPDPSHVAVHVLSRSLFPCAAR